MQRGAFQNFFDQIEITKALHSAETVLTSSPSLRWFNTVEEMKISANSHTIFSDFRDFQTGKAFQVAAVCVFAIVHLFVTRKFPL